MTNDINGDAVQEPEPLMNGDVHGAAQEADLMEDAGEELLNGDASEEPQMNGVADNTPETNGIAGLGQELMADSKAENDHDVEGSAAAQPPFFARGPNGEVPEDYLAMESDPSMYAHRASAWMYNSEDNMYINLLDSSVWVFVGDVAQKLVLDAVEEAPQRLVGIVSWYNAHKHYGFIKSGDSEYFVHQKELRNCEALEADAEVSFAVGMDETGRYLAVNVEVAIAEQQEEEEEDGSESEVEVDLAEGILEGCAIQKGPDKDTCEDRILSKTKLPMIVTGDEADGVIFGIFDGHSGNSCSDYAQSRLATNFISCLSQRRDKESDIKHVSRALTQAFNLTEHNFLQRAKRLQDSSGTTACVVVLYGPDSEGGCKIVSANCGDSRAVLSRKGKAFRLSDDHKPDRAEERARIEALGGEVQCIEGIWRVMKYHKKGGMGPNRSGYMGLAVSRGLGDALFKEPKKLVSPEPEILVYDLDFEDDEFIVIASDGIWDVLTDTDVVNIARPLLDNIPKACEAVILAANAKGSRDDKSVIITRFGWNKTAAMSLEELGGSGSDPEKVASDLGKSMFDESDPEDEPKASFATDSDTSESASTTPPSPSGIPPATATPQPEDVNVTHTEPVDAEGLMETDFTGPSLERSTPSEERTPAPASEDVPGPSDDDDIFAPAPAAENDIPAPAAIFTGPAMEEDIFAGPSLKRGIALDDDDIFAGPPAKRAAGMQDDDDMFADLGAPVEAAPAPLGPQRPKRLFASGEDLFSM